MVWIYDSPPFTKRELRAYRSIRRKLKDKAFVDKIIKVISLYLYLKRNKFASTDQIIRSAYYDKSKTKPIFNEKTANSVLRAMTQRGGDSQYPYTDTLVKGLLRDYTPEFVSNPVGAVNELVTGTVDTLKNNIPFSDLALEAIHSGSSIGVTSANDIGQAIGGPIGAVAVAPFTAIVTGVTSALSIGEGDLGGAVAHVANWIPIIGIIFSKVITQGEHLANVLKNHPSLSSLVPYMTEFHQSAGKRLSTMKHRSNKWLKTQRKKSVTL
jgi:hypothetical protein